METNNEFKDSTIYQDIFLIFKFLFFFLGVLFIAMTLIFCVAFDTDLFDGFKFVNHAIWGK